MVSTIKSLGLVCAILAQPAAILAQNDTRCFEPDAEYVMLDLSEAEVNTTTMTVSGKTISDVNPVLRFKWEVTAQQTGSQARNDNDPSTTPQNPGMFQPNIFNTSGSGGLDPDLENASVGLALIIQDPDTPVDEPNDFEGGGFMTFTFKTKNPTALAASQVIIIDFDGDRPTNFRVNSSAQDELQGQVVTPSFDGSVQIYNVSNFDGEAAEGALEEELLEIRHRFPGSGAIQIGVCMRPTGLTGDPHVQRYGKAEKRNIYLPPGEWVDMFSGPRYTLMGRVFEKEGFEAGKDMIPIEWFDGLAIVDHTNEARITVVNMTMPHDKTVGHVNDGVEGTRIDYFRLEVDGEVVGKSGTTYAAANGEVTVRAAKLYQTLVPGAINDALTVTTPDFTIMVKNEGVSNQHAFANHDEQLRETHLNVNFIHLDPSKVHGPLADLIFKNDEDLSEEAQQWEDKANAFAVAQMS